MRSVFSTLASVALATSISLSVVSGLAAAANSPAKDAALVELMDEMNIDGMWGDMVRAMADPVMAQLSQQFPNAPDDVKRGINDIVLQSLGELKPLVVSSVARLLTKYYTAEEMQDLVAFYRTPTGRKSLQLMPALNQEIMALTPQIQQEVMPKMARRLEEFLKGRGLL
ncbi:MAG: DUF2059 domain-containing protein [Alphaproteobacteria bacterium]|nr:DUF2059 domain-containing protein [Alphaproteobacteria bacterium]